MTVTKKMLLHLFNASSYLKVIPVIRFQDKKVNPTWKSFHVHVTCVCLQRAAPMRRASAMRTASAGATQRFTDKLKVQTHLIMTSLMLDCTVHLLL